MAAQAESLARALDSAGMVVAGIGADRWTASTPCAEWDVRALLNHLVAGNQVFARIVRGELTREQALQVLATDVLGEDPSSAFDASAAEVVEAFSAHGALGREVTVPFGTVPGAVALHLRVTEALVHGWDLARATGQDVAPPDDVVEAELAFTRQFLTAIPPGRTPFAPSLPVPPDAPALDRLVALLGRSPDRG